MYFVRALPVYTGSRHGVLHWRRMWVAYTQSSTLFGGRDFYFCMFINTGDNVHLAQLSDFEHESVSKLNDDVVPLLETEISHLSDDRVHNLFVDPRGCHIIVSMQSGTNFYTTRSSRKLKQISKAKDLLFNAVLWNQYNESETTTQEILIGTNDGVIYEAMLSSSEDRFLSSTVESLWRELITLDNSLTSLAAVRYPPGSALVPVGEPQMCAVLATTAGRLYQFSGCIQPPDSVSARMYITAQSAAAALREGYLPGLYAPIFEAYERNSAGSKCIEFPMSYGYSDLKVYQRPEDEVPSRFAWMTASGLYYNAELVEHYMSLGMYTEALFTLSAHPSCASLHYTYAVQLSSCDPKMLVDAWIRAGQRLDPSRLLPTILLLPNEEATRYLEFAVDQLHCSSQAVHHQLIMLYASAADSADLPNNEVRLLDYLARFTTPNLCEVFSDVVRNAGLDLSDPVKALTGDGGGSSTALKIIEPGKGILFVSLISLCRGCLRQSLRHGV
nr:unnamed protein product [Spirometra erinaceieuropaei]